jgi:hypothetical protein
MNGFGVIGESFVRKILVICQAVLFLLLLQGGAPAGPASDEVTLSVDTDGPTLEVHTGTAQFRIPENNCWSFTWEPGYPRLPVRKVWFLLPPDAVLQTVTLDTCPGQTGTFTPGGAMEITQLPGNAVPPVAGTGLWPNCWARVTCAGQFRKYRYALVEIYPYRCNLSDGRLMNVESVSIKLAFSRNAASKVHPNLLVQDWLPGQPPRFVNRGQFEKEYEPPDDPVLAAAPPVDYLIITTNAIAAQPQLASFVALKEAKGLIVNVATIESFVILPGPDLADQIRSYLQANYAQWGLKYVLLIGTPDPDIPDHASDTVGTVPMKLCYPQSYWTDKPDNDIEAATDYYFADLTGNWDADGDGFYGEAYSELWGYTGDLVPGGIDYAPEVIVGRIPFYDTSDVRDILDNIIAYETAGENYDWASSGALEWRKKVFCVTHRLNGQTPTYEFSEHLRKFITEPEGYSLFVAHDEDYGVMPPADLLGYATTDIRDELANRYGTVIWACHGREREAENVLESDQCWAIPDNAPPIILQICCLTGYPEIPLNLSFLLMQNGTVGTICATRSTWYLDGWERPYQGGMQDLGYFMVEELLIRRRPLGEVLQNARNTYCFLSYGGHGYHGANLMTFNLYGEPTCSLGILRIDTTVLPVGREGEKYAAALLASGGVEPYSWTVVAGQVPAGLFLSPAGLLSGQPADRGTWVFSVKVTDSTGASDTRELVFHAKSRWKGGCTLSPAAPAATLLPFLLVLILLALRRRRPA